MTHWAGILAILVLAPNVAAAGSPSKASSAAENGVEARKSMAVEIADLDLSTAAGIGKLQRRVQSAARRVCEGGVSRLYGQYERTKADSCYKLTVAHAMKQVSATVVRESERSKLVKDPDCNPRRID